MKTIIAVNGACGRMGQRIMQLAHADPDLKIGAALDSATHPALRPRAFRTSRWLAASSFE